MNKRDGLLTLITIIIVLLSVFFLLFTFAGKKDNKEGKKYKKMEAGLHMLTAEDGCNYVLYKDKWHGAVTMVHSGNCKNPTHE